MTPYADIAATNAAADALMPLLIAWTCLGALVFLWHVVTR